MFVNPPKPKTYTKPKARSFLRPQPPFLPSFLLASQSLTMMYFSMSASQSTIPLCTEPKPPHFLHHNLLPSFLLKSLTCDLALPMFVNPPTPYTEGEKKKQIFLHPTSFLPSVFSCFVPTQLLATMLFPNTFANVTTSSTPTSLLPFLLPWNHLRPLFALRPSALAPNPDAPEQHPCKEEVKPSGHTPHL